MLAWFLRSVVKKVHRPSVGAAMNLRIDQVQLYMRNGNLMKGSLAFQMQSFGAP
jgi:hypothetical protein